MERSARGASVAAPGPRPVGGLPRRPGLAAPGRGGRGPGGRVGRAARTPGGRATGRRRWPSPPPRRLAAGAERCVVVPDHRDVDRLDAALTAVLGTGRHVRLTADQGPQARYTAWLKVLRGHVQVVIGTRAAAFAPVHDLGLVAWWDDGDDLLAEPRAPYHHVGVVLGLRAAATGAALLAGWLRAQPARAGRRSRRARSCPSRPTRRRVRGGGTARHRRGRGPRRGARRPGRPRPPPVAGVARRQGRPASTGPCSSRCRGAATCPSLSCAECRTPVRCARCQGPVAARARSGAAPACRWCGLVLGPARFRVRPLRLAPAALVDHRRAAHRRGDRPRLPGLPGHTSGSGEVLAAVGRSRPSSSPRPGAEPVADGGYTGGAAPRRVGEPRPARARRARSRRCAGGWPRRRWRGRAAPSC